jgi:hypothetical protein
MHHKSVLYLIDLTIILNNPKIILKWIFKKWGGEVWTGLSGLRIGTGGGLL